MNGTWTVNTRGPAGLVLFLLLMAGCDSAPIAPDPYARAPEVSELSYTPGAVAVDALPPSSREGEFVRVPVSIRVRATDADGDLGAVAFVLKAPIPQSDPIAEGTLTTQGGTAYGIDQDVLFPTGLTGAYVLIVYASDERGMLGNEVRGVIELTATGNPPSIDSIEAPDRVQRPGAGQPAVPIRLIATVSDPDGLANIARVEMRVGGGSPLLLCDDGGQAACNPGFASGDQTAGDGRFTLTIQIDGSNTPGDRTLEFIAIDRSGLTSETVTRVLTIE